MVPPLVGRSYTCALVWLTSQTVVFLSLGSFVVFSPRASLRWIVFYTSSPPWRKTRRVLPFFVSCCLSPPCLFSLLILCPRDPSFLTPPCDSPASPFFFSFFSVDPSISYTRRTSRSIFCPFPARYPPLFFFSFTPSAPAGGFV